MDYQHRDGLVVFRDVPDLGLGRPTDGLARLVSLTEPGVQVDVIVRVGELPGSGGVLVQPVGFPPGGYAVSDIFPVDRSRIVTWPEQLSDLMSVATA